MHYTTHALLNCVAWFNLLCYGTAVRLAPTDVLSHFARTLGSVLEPTLANELQSSRLNHSGTHGEGLAISKRQVDSRPISDQERNNINPTTPGIQSYPNQGYPFQYGRIYQFRYPAYAQQVSQNLYPGGGAFNNQPLPNSLPIDPRFFQPQIGYRPREPLRPELPRPANTNTNVNNNENAKDTRNSNANSIQNLDTNVDSKSSAQNRPFDGPESLNQPGGNSLDPELGNLRVDNRFSAIDYERVRQNYYSDPPINQQRNYYSTFNDIPLNGGPPYRSTIGGRYSGLDYSGDGPGRPGITSSEFSSGSGVGGIGDPYFGSFLQGPYRSFGYNSLAGNVAGGSAGANGGLPFSENFGSPYNRPQYSGGFGGNFYSGGPGNFGFNNGDSSLRASASKESLAEAVIPRSVSQEPKEQKASFGEENGKNASTRIVEKDRADQA